MISVFVQGSIDHLEEGTYYLTRIDEKYVRYYAVKGEEEEVASTA